MPLKILPHGRLQEWVAEEQGYFAAEGLEYTFLPEGDYGVPVGQVSTGAFETFGAGRGGAGISCACHWATNTAAGQRAGRLVTTAYSVAPCAVMVPPESPVRGPADLAGVPVGVGYHSGSHFATVQALEAVLAPEQATLTFLRRRQLGARLGGPSLPLDVGVSADIPAAIRRAVILRDQHCRFPGGCDQPASGCEVHHLRHRKDGGPTSVKDCALFCFFHHQVVIHQWGWTVVLNPDGTTTAWNKDKTKIIHSHSPPARPG